MDNLSKNVEHQRMLQDITENGINNEGVYRGVKWKTTRPYKTYLCGYVIINDKISDDKINIMEKYSHHEFTSYLGFDCAHFDDYFTLHPNLTGFNFRKNVTYKNYEYVLNCLYKIIDAYLDN